jgi:RNA polymerase sigma-70 factor (ECF subfamily)
VSRRHDPPDEQLVEAVQGGCHESFSELVKRYQVPLLHFIQNRTGSMSEAEDLVQDAFLRAYQNIDRYQPKWRFSTWLYTIAFRLAVSHHRRKRPDATSEFSHMQGTGNGPEALVSETEERSRLWEIAKKVLSQSQYTIVWMHYVEQVPLNEVAKMIEKSPVSVRAALFRARKKLMPHLQDSQGKTAIGSSGPTGMFPSILA